MEAINYEDIENTANIEMRSECCDAEVYSGGGGYDGRDVVPFRESCSECAKPNPGTYRIHTKTGKKVVGGIDVDKIF